MVIENRMVLFSFAFATEKNTEIYSHIVNNK